MTSDILGAGAVRIESALLGWWLQTCLMLETQSVEAGL